MGNTLDSPIVEKDGEEYVSSTGIVVGASGMQGWRLEMEDAHVSIDIPSQPDHLFLAVFDGHAGAGGAKFAAKEMIGILEKCSEWLEYKAGNCGDIQLLGNAMITTFIEVDSKMRVHQDSTAGADTSGCTSVTCIITPKYILCANAGDSRCVMGTNGVAKALSDDHKPRNDAEMKRILAAGGFVQWDRVDGDLAVSRALGDFSYKNRPDLPPKDQKVSCHPDISIHERLPTDDIVLLGCDGVWDVLSTTEAINLVREIYEAGENSVVKIAEEVLDIALGKGSKDNISAVVVRLAGATIGPPEGGGVDARRNERTAAAALKQQESVDRD